MGLWLHQVTLSGITPVRMNSYLLVTLRTTSYRCSVFKIVHFNLEVIHARITALKINTQSIMLCK